MNSPNIRSVGVKGIVVAALLLSFVVLSVFLFVRHTQNPLDIAIDHQVQRSQSYRQKWEQKGVVSALDHARLIKISTYIEQRQEMSDDDLEFWTTLLQKGPLRDTPSNRFLFYSDVLGDAAGRKHLSLSGQKKMYDAVLPFVHDAAYVTAMDPSDTRTDPSDPSTQKNLRIGSETIAVQLLAQTRDPRALGILEGIAQNSPSPALRETAHEYHDKLAMALR